MIGGIRMHPRFMSRVESLDPKFQQLITMQPVKYYEIPRHLPQKGLYLFSEGTSHLYVGRTNRLRERLRGHCIPSATHFTATFAFRIAREKTGFRKATYKTKGSRADLIDHELFGPAFLEAKERISRMDIRYVEEDDPISQALLEIYTATALETPYNDFDTH
jgi:hypothetical protein